MCICVFYLFYLWLIAYLLCDRDITKNKSAEVYIKVNEHDCDIGYIEHVELVMTATYPKRGDLSVDLTSAQGKCFSALKLVASLMRCPHNQTIQLLLCMWSVWIVMINIVKISEKFKKSYSA